MTTRKSNKNLGSTVKLAVIDDSAVIRRRLLSMLTQVDGVELVGEATDAIEGLDLIRAKRPDVVILDVRMENRSGIGLLEDLKYDSNMPIVIVLTNYPYVAYRQRCLQLGARYFFDKTTEFVRVAEVIQELVGDTDGVHESV
ncbi:MAG: response regulator transcription factor [Gemmatimonadota bacterium]|nr:MAG: response regulator transcription factor [Gemmatimonadota bacterium]